MPEYIPLVFWSTAFQDRLPDSPHVALDHHLEGEAKSTEGVCGSGLRMGLAMFALRFESV